MTVVEQAVAAMAQAKQKMLKLRQENKELLAALKAILERYTELVNSGDCGNWNPEAEDEVIAARKAVSEATK